MTPTPKPFVERAELLLTRVFRGLHHVSGLKKEGKYWTCLHCGDAATYDFDTLTMLVLGAHEYHIRVSLTNGGPRALKVWLHDRKREGEHCFDRHPTIDQAIENWNNR